MRERWISPTSALRARAAAGPGRVERFSSTGHAVARLRRLAFEVPAMHALRRALLDRRPHLIVARLSDAEVVDELARCLVRGSVELVSLARPLRALDRGGETEPEAASARPALDRSLSAEVEADEQPRSMSAELFVEEEPRSMWADIPEAGPGDADSGVDAEAGSPDADSGDQAQSGATT